MFATSAGLYSTSTLIAFSETDTTSKKPIVQLQYSNISLIVTNAFSKNRRLSKYPIGILSIPKPPACRAKSLEILTKWIICHLEEKDLSSNDNSQTTESWDVFNTTSSGIYLWPRPFLFCDKTNNAPVLVWVMYGDVKSLELALFSRMAASIKFMVDTKDLDRILISESLKATMKARVLRQIDELQLIPAELPSSDIVTLDTFEAYLQFIADKVNGNSSWDDLIVNGNNPSNTENTYSAKQPVALLPSLKPSVSHNAIQSDKVYETVPFPNKAADPAQFNNQLCEIHDCPTHLLSAQTSLSFWIENKMTLNTLSDMTQLVQAHLKFPEQHGITDEVGELVKILRLFIAELHNMFDNYLCFFGNTDIAQVQRFIAMAEKRAKGNLNDTKRRVHKKFLEPIFEKCCAKIVNIFINDNQQIVKLEEMLANEVYWKIFEAFQKKMKNLNCGISQKELAVVSQTMKYEALKVLSRCLDCGDKLNGVQSVFSKRLESELDKFMSDFLNQQQIKQQQIENTIDDQHIVQNCLGKYIYGIDNRWRSFGLKKLHERVEGHNDILSDILQNVSDPKDIKQVSFLSDLYFLHKNELLEQEMDQSNLDPKSIPNQHTLCVYLAPQWIRISIETEHGKQHNATFGLSNVPYLPPILAMTNEGFMYGWLAAERIRKYPETIHCKGGVINYVTNTPEDETLSLKMLSCLFQSIKQQLEGKLGTYSKVLVCVPTWLDVASRTRIRAACLRAEFKQVFLVDEAFAGAQLLLNSELSEVPKTEETYALLISVTNFHIDMRLYTQDDSKLVLRLATQMKITKDKANQDPELLLQSTFAELVENADYLNSNDVKIKICSICELNEWEASLKSFSQKIAACELALNLREQENVMGMLLGLLEQTEKLHVRFDVVSNGENAVNVLPTSDLYVKKRKHLLEQCQLIRNKLDDGSVQLGALTKKLINQVLDRAESVGKDEHTPSNDLDVQYDAVNSIMEQYMVIYL